jgi:hypothetical protein
MKRTEIKKEQTLDERKGIGKQREARLAKEKGRTSNAGNY